MGGSLNFMDCLGLERLDIAFSQAWHLECIPVKGHVWT